jgi:hypothetical protein
MEGRKKVLVKIQKNKGCLLPTQIKLLFFFFVISEDLFINKFHTFYGKYIQNRRKRLYYSG